MKHSQLAKDIIANVGGTENISNVVHCMTRLRFNLKDNKQANTDVLNNMDGVVTVMQSGGQYQVVIGNHVSDVYKAVVHEGDLKLENTVETKEASGSEEKGSLFTRFIQIISGIFTPILGVLAASGMIKGFNVLFLELGWLVRESGTYQILNTVGDALFFFLPVFLGYTAMKKFGGTPFLGMVIGAALVYPNLANVPTSTDPLYTLFSGSIFESPVHIEFLGIPVILMTYSMSVIPIIIASFFAVKVERFVTKISPSAVKTFTVPMFTLLIIIPLTLIIIGPTATWASQLLGMVTLWIYSLSPIIAGMIVSGFWLVFVMFGLHWGFIPIALNELATIGNTPTLTLMFAHSFALSGTILAVWIKTKISKTKVLSAPAFISAMFGITEPGLYGVVLPLKKPFIITIISSAVGGGILGFCGTTAYTLGGGGFFKVATFIHPETGIDLGFWGGIIAIIVSFTLAFTLTYIFGLKNTEQTVEEPVTQEKANINELGTILNPIKGQIVPLTKVPDQVFASGAMGRGVGIVPSEGRAVAPVSGTVTTLFQTKHAIGITSDDGMEILIHIGIDTVKLNGEHFKAHVSQGDQINKGDLLVEFDIEKIKGEGFSTITPIIITNSSDYEVFECTSETNVEELDYLLKTV
ncbi:beta-glucoside-specific PTS transporter subunit IIABC [Alkalicoccobacillus gibsonii]|uniref:Beta-glucoside-specific PTS transporter subunit IIABC n=1 Tax=Alkalicoccobacillus gibsonii TaxID=79881 RepID=A0ABU9VEL7_9BACI